MNSSAANTGRYCLYQLEAPAVAPQQQPRAGNCSWRQATLASVCISVAVNPLSATGGGCAACGCAVCCSSSSNAARCARSRCARCPSPLDPGADSQAKACGSCRHESTSGVCTGIELQHAMHGSFPAGTNLPRPPTHPPSPSLPTTRLPTWLGMKRTPGDEIHHHFNLLWRQDSLGCSKIQHLAQELEHFWCCHRRQLCPHARRRRPAAFFCAGVHEGVAESLPRCRHVVVSDKHNLVGISGLDADNHAQGWMRSDHAIEPLLKGAEVFVLLLGSASNQPAGSAARRGRLAITAGCVRAASGAHSNYSTKWMCGS